MWKALRRLVEKEGISHVFYPWAVSERIRPLGIPSGIMVMDLLWHAYPDAFADPKELDSILQHNLEAADWIFPISEFTAGEIQNAFHFAHGKLHTVPHGADSKQIPASTGQAASEGTAPWFLYPASTFPNKNHLTLFEAARILFEQGSNVRIVLTSRSIDRLRDHDNHSGYQAVLKDWLNRHPQVLEHIIDLRGEVTVNELNDLYAGCRAVVLPSLYEGFGLPLVEAFERNVPVICSDIPPFREQIERYGLNGTKVISNAKDPNALAASISDTMRSRKNTLSIPALKSCINNWLWSDAALAYIEALNQPYDHNRRD